jgi:hypothetical protein
MSPTILNSQITDSVAPDPDDQSTSADEQAGPDGSSEADENDEAGENG